MLKPTPKLTDIAVECSISDYVDFQRVCVDSHRRRFRVTLHSDPSYPNQSRGAVELWDGSRWQQVHHVDPMAHTQVWQALNGYLPRERHAAVRVEAARFAAELLKVAAVIVGDAQP
jgi:hypothetical protein